MGDRTTNRFFILVKLSSSRRSCEPYAMPQIRAFYLSRSSQYQTPVLQRPAPSNVEPLPLVVGVPPPWQQASDPPPLSAVVVPSQPSLGVNRSPGRSSPEGSSSSIGSFRAVVSTGMDASELAIVYSLSTTGSSPGRIWERRRMPCRTPHRATR